MVLLETNLGIANDVHDFVFSSITKLNILWTLIWTTKTSHIISDPNVFHSTQLFSPLFCAESCRGLLINHMVITNQHPSKNKTLIRASQFALPFKIIVIESTKNWVRSRSRTSGSTICKLMGICKFQNRNKNLEWKKIKKEIKQKL